MAYFKIKYPCGLELISKAFGGTFLGNSDFDRISREGCPIHGKKCSGFPSFGRIPFVYTGRNKKR